MATRALSRRIGVVKAAILAAVLAILGSRLHRPIDGEHYFRQTHVASNIDKYVADGLSLHPATYNTDAPLALYDFPAYEILVAALCRTLRTPALETARVVNLVFFSLTYFMLDRLMARTRVRPIASLATLFVFAWAPLNLYYVWTPIPDVLAVSASLASLLAFVCWEASPPGWRASLLFAAMCLSGVLATLVKNPVYLPVAVAISVFVLVRHGARGLLRPGILAFGVLIGLSVVAFKAYSNGVNHVAVFLTPDEAGQYFGPLGQRLDIWSWRAVFKNVAKTVNPLASLFSLAGVFAYALRSKSPFRSLYLGLGAGSLVTLLVFFSRFTWHDYYYLPFVFPLAFFAGDLADRLRLWAEGLVPRAHARRVGMALLLLLVASSLLLSPEGLAAFLSGTKAGQTTRGLVEAGTFIAQETRPRDFVVYVVDDHENWNPAYLYFAKRDGYNLRLHGLSHKSVEAIRSSFLPGHDRLLVFCPRPFVRVCAGRLKMVAPDPGDAGDPGFIFDPYAGRDPTPQDIPKGSGS
jgi:hypothetical protein